MLNSRLTNLAEIMNRLYVASIGLRAIAYRNTFHDINPEIDYGMKDVINFRMAYFGIESACLGESTLMHSERINGQWVHHEKGKQAPLYLPETQRVAHNIWTRNSWDKIYDRYQEDGSFSGHTEKGYTLLSEWDELIQAFNNDLEGALVFQLNEQEKELYSQSGPLAFGEEVIKKIPKIEADIRAAGHCFAASEYTASVFHLGRATESIVKKFARKNRVDLYFRNKKTGKLDKKHLKNWYGINKDLRTKIASIKKPEIRALYSHAIESSESLRKLRNGVDHATDLGSKIYEKRKEVLAIWEETKRFAELTSRFFPNPRSAKP